MHRPKVIQSVEKKLLQVGYWLARKELYSFELHEYTSGRIEKSEKAGGASRSPEGRNHAKCWKKLSALSFIV